MRVRACVCVCEFNCVYACVCTSVVVFFELYFLSVFLFVTLLASCSPLKSSLLRLRLCVRVASRGLLAGRPLFSLSSSALAFLGDAYRRRVGGSGEIANFSGRGGPIDAPSVLCEVRMLWETAGVNGIPSALLSVSSLLFLREGGRGGGTRAGGPTYVCMGVSVIL
jgi:hypothetical protein